MGRELKRVPLDFNHPIGQVWPGYINEHYKECATCGGSGTTPARDYLSKVVQSLMWNREGDAELAALTTGLAGRAPFGRVFGHDSLDSYAANRRIIEAAGLDPDKWGWCAHCGGDGEEPESKEASAAWEKTEPPTGEGWQVWETVSEGSPVSPVLPTREALIEWLMWRGYSQSAAENFTERGWAISMMAVSGPDGVVITKDIETLAD